MNTTSKIIAAAAFALTAVAGAHAEQYQGVLDPVSALSRAEVSQQAVAQSHAANQNVNASSLVIASPAQPRDRAAVRAEAVAAAHDGTQNLDAGSFAASTIPANVGVGSNAAIVGAGQ